MEMPPLVNDPSAGFPGGGAIPPPPSAHHEQPINPFPGATQANLAWPPPVTAPAWQFSSSPWAHPWSPTPAASYGEFSPASRAIDTPAGLGQPIAPSPWFNANASPERRWKQGFDGTLDPGCNAVPMERPHSQDPMHPHSPNFFSAGGVPLTRSVSAGAPTRAMNQSRVVHTGGTWGSQEEYDADYLARRPRDYRPDFPSSLWRFPSINRHKSGVEEFKDPTKRTVTDLLRYKRLDPRISYDLRYPPYPGNLHFPYLGRQPNDIDLAQLATSPPVERMRLVHPLVPWYIDVRQSQDNGITVRDVVEQVFFALHVQISLRHYWNEGLDSVARERISKAFERRTEGCAGERANGVRRVDYLGDKVVFVGLVRTRERLWEMKTVV